MKRNKINLLCAALMLMFCMLLFVGCSRTESEETDSGPVFTGEKTVISNDVLAGYSIVRSDNASDSGIQAAIELRDGLKNVLDLNLTTDWVKRGEDVPAGRSEILVGQTNRPESIALQETLRHQDFAIAHTDHRIVIVGGSDLATQTAVAFFLENFVDTESGQISVPVQPFIYQSKYEVETMTINDISIAEYSVYGEQINNNNSAADSALRLSDTLTRLTGYRVAYKTTLGEGKHIRFSYDDSAADTVSVFMDGEDLCITASDDDGMIYAYAYLCQEILGLNRITGTGNELDIRIAEKKTFDLNTIAASETYSIYVSPHGTDTGDGSAENPFGTLGAALDAVGNNRKLQPMEIILTDGDYYITESVHMDKTNSGTRYAPLVIRAQNNGKVRLIGGVKVDPSQCQSVTDPAILERVPDETAARKLMMLDISTLTENIPDMQDTTPLEIFFDSTALTRSRFPNKDDGDGYLRSEKILAASEENYQTEPATFTYTDDIDRALRWSEESMNDLYILSYLGFDWYSDLLRVTAIDPVNRTVTTEIGGTYLPKEGNRFFFLNLLEEIDQPGESYIDRQNGLVYYYPYESTAKEIFVSTLNESMIDLNGCTNVVLEGLSFAYSRKHPLTATAVDTLTISDCDVSCIADNAMELDGYRITVDGCEISNTWSGGIYMTGGDRVNLISGENVIKNCVIHDVNRSRINYKPGVKAASTGLVVENNVFYNAIHEMIAVSDNNVRIAYNEIYNCVTDCSDMGAIYFGRDPSQLGIEICYNYFHDIGNAYGGFGQQAIFMDDGCAGAHVHHNLFYKATTDTYAVKFHSTQYAVVEHNIFAEAPSAVYNGAWTYMDGKQYYWLGWMYDLIPERQHSIQNRIAASGMDSDLWRAYYKDTQWMPLFDLIHDDVRQKIQSAHENGVESELNIALLESMAPLASNIVANNVFLNIDSYDEIGTMWSGGIVTDKNNVPLTEDAFVDYGTDFTLTESALAAIRETIPDFENFPMDKIGPGGNG